MTFCGGQPGPRQRGGRAQAPPVSFAFPAGPWVFGSTRLKKLGVDHRRTSRFDADAIVLRDADGIELELVGQASDDRWKPWHESPVDRDHAIRGFHSVTLTVAESAATLDLLTSTMGFRKGKKEGNRTQLETGAGGPHSVVDVIESPEGPVGEESVGTVHHVAWRTPDAEAQVSWRDLLPRPGRNVTPVIDRWYFKSIYFREPGGVLFEIATDGPGFTVDEPPEKLGTTLSLPPWFQVRRDQLDEILPPIVVPTTATTGAHQGVVNQHERGH